MASFGKILRILFLILMIGVSFSWPVMAPTQTDAESDGTSVVAQEPVEAFDLKPEIGKIDQAGNKVGEKIEKFGAKASDRLGGWIDSKFYKDISWLILLFCLLLVFVVVTVERLVRLLIQRKIDTIPSVDGQISWVCLQLKIELFEKEYALSSGVQG